MDKTKIKVEMSLADFEELDSDAKYWLSRYNDMRRVILKYFRFSNGKYYWTDSADRPIADALQDYLNKEND